MEKKKNIIIPLEGGTGKQIAFTALLPYIYKEYENIYIITAYDHIFENNPYIKNTFNYCDDIYQSLVLRDDTRIIYRDPYNNEKFIKKECHLLEAWAEELEIDIDKSGIDLRPELYLTNDEKEQVHNLISDFDFENFIIIQMTGGQSPVDFDSNSSVKFNIKEPLKRNYPYFKSLVKLIKENYPEQKILRYALPNEYLPDSIKDDVYTSRPPLPFKLYHEIVKYANQIISIDSSLQHICAAAERKAIVIWGDTDVAHFGYSIHDNLREENLNKSPYFKPLGPTNSFVEFPPVEKVINSLNKSNLEIINNITDENKNQVNIHLA